MRKKPREERIAQSLEDGSCTAAVEVLCVSCRVKSQVHNSGRHKQWQVKFLHVTGEFDFESKQTYCQHEMRKKHEGAYQNLIWNIHELSEIHIFGCWTEKRILRHRYSVHFGVARKVKEFAPGVEPATTSLPMLNWADSQLIRTANLSDSNLYSIPYGIYATETLALGYDLSPSRNRVWD